MVKYNRGSRRIAEMRKQRLKNEFRSLLPVLSGSAAFAGCGAASLVTFAVKKISMEKREAQLAAKRMEQARKENGAAEKILNGVRQSGKLKDDGILSAEESAAILQEGGKLAINTPYILDSVITKFEIRKLESELAKTKKGMYPDMLFAGIAAWIVISGLSAVGRSLRSRISARNPEQIDGEQESGDEIKGTAKPEPAPRERAQTPSSLQKEMQKKKKERGISAGQLSGAIKPVFGENAEAVAGILALLRDRGVIGEADLRKVLETPGHAKGVLKWKRSYTASLVEERGLDFAALTNGNGNGNGHSEERKSDSYPPVDPNYVTTEEALRSIGLSSAWGNKPAAVHRALIKSGFEIMPASSGGHLRICYEGEIAKDDKGQPLMIVKASASSEIPPGTMKNIAKSTYLFKRKKDAEEAAGSKLEPKSLP